MRITPDDPLHERLLGRVDGWLTENGFLLSSTTYHDAWPASMIDLIKNRWSATALYLRGRADRLAVHRELPLEFEYEAKACRPTRPNLAIEALPLMHSLDRAKRHVRILYACTDQKGADRGFWCHKPPSFSRMFLPENAYRNRARYYGGLLAAEFGKPKTIAPVREGSGDPFILVREADLLRLASWQKLVAEALHQSSNKVAV